MDLSLSFSAPKDQAKLIQWAVFIAVIAVFAWTFWVYWDTTQKLEQIADNGTVPPMTVNEEKLNEVLAAEENRTQNFATPPAIPYDPFQ